MPFNVVCRRTTFECSDKNKFKYFLGNLPKKSEITGKDVAPKVVTNNNEDGFEYVELLNKITGSLNTWFYIEPFVGNSESINAIKGDFTKYGTDLDEYKIGVLKNKYPERVKNFQVRDYKSWNKVLLDSKYKGHCIVYCEPPYLDKQDEFKISEFVKVVEEWSHMNRVFVRMPQKAKNWELICKISSASNMYEVKPLKK